jgi:hypothetical protein
LYKLSELLFIAPPASASTENEFSIVRDLYGVKAQALLDSMQSHLDQRRSAAVGMSSVAITQRLREAGELNRLEYRWQKLSRWLLLRA